MIIGAGLIEADGAETLYNTRVVALPDGRAYRHRKLHAFVSPCISSGSEYTVFDAGLGTRMGVLACCDNNICENVRITALKGAEVVLAPHQTGGCRSANPHTMGLVDRRLWENKENDPAAIEEELRGPKGRGWLMRWLPARAHDNGVFYVFSNGVGATDDEIRTGNAMIIDLYGRVVAETCRAGDDMVVADLDPSLLVENTGQRWIRTRRPELYGPLAQPTGLERDTRTVRFDEKEVCGRRPRTTRGRGRILFRRSYASGHRRAEGCVEGEPARVQRVQGERRQLEGRRVRHHRRSGHPRWGGARLQQ